MRIEIVVFDGFDELDAVLPFEVFRNAAQASDWDVALVGPAGAGEIVASHGMRLQVDAGLGRPDAIVVPGGGWGDRAPKGTRQQVAEGHLPDRIRELAPGCAWVSSVCTGAMVLAAAGLTKGRPATTHHVALEELRESGAHLVDARVVDDGDLITCGGVTSGLDMALWMVERELGPELATRIAREMECERSQQIWKGELIAADVPRTR
ncbi:MAG TPA: DJ-1/PfpI family protein [Frankiaceae bacterium]|jgi:transcriptional regulator GlxA family with amidase domain|nr:DJ-1/PfpI family protein [Frankiaceae bacterium]